MFRRLLCLLKGGCDGYPVCVEQRHGGTVIGSFWMMECRRCGRLWYIKGE